MRVFTARFVLGTLLLASVCVIADPAQAGPFRRRAANNACCPTTSYGYGTGSTYGGATGYGGASYAAPGYSYGTPYAGNMAYGATPCCGGAAYGGTTYGPGYQTSSSLYTMPGYQPGYNIAPAGGSTGGVPGVLPARAESTRAKITDSGFEPATITITPGTTVRWVNEGKDPHTVTSAKGDWTSNDLSAGAEFTATFTQPGTFEYYCKHNKDMKGTIIVK